MQALADFLQAAVAAVAAVRLFNLGLNRRQPALFAYLIYTALYLFALGSIPSNSAIYFWLYMFFDVLNWIVSLFVVREMFALVLDDYPGIRTAGRWTMYGAIALALTGSLAIARIFWGGGPNGRSPHLYYLLVANRSIVFTLSVVIISILLFLSRYPLHLHRNTYVSSIFFGAVFLSEALVTLIDSLGAHLYSPYADTVQVGFAALCLVAWTMMLGPIRDTAAARITFESPQDHELLQQLDSLNRLLSRAGRR